MTVGAGMAHDTDDVLAALDQIGGEYGPERWQMAHEGRFPAAALAAITRIGLLTAPLPVALGGLGWGTQAAGAQALSRALRLVGRANLSLGRVWEGHVNAVRLLHRMAGPALLARVAEDLRAGHLIGLWVTSFAAPVTVTPELGGLLLHGVKDVCSGAGHATRAVISAVDADGRDRLIYVDAEAAEILPARKLAMHGMRATSTMAVRFDLRVPADSAFGSPGEYTAEPDFSAGAWRTSAVTVGGLEALVEQAVLQLAARRRHADPHQQARIGQLMLAREGAILWLARAAELAEADDPAPEATAAAVNLARIAIEECVLRAIPLVQRSLGLAAMQEGNPAERLMRDLATYLRQPAGDEVLAGAAAWYAARIVGS